MSDEPHKISDIKTKVYNYKGKTKVKIEFNVATDKYYDKDEVAARLERNKHWMLDHLIGWADFDEDYSINLFADALENLGRGLLRWDNAILSKRNGRRAMFAGKQLRKIYNSRHNDDRDKSWLNLITKNPLDIGFNRNGRRVMTYMYNCDNAMGMDRKEYYEKMWKIIHKRLKKVDEANKEWIWSYINKYIQMWWD